MEVTFIGWKLIIWTFLCFIAIIGATYMVWKVYRALTK